MVLVLHMLVSLKHLLIDRDAVLQRTWFWQLSSPGNCVKKSHEFQPKGIPIIVFSNTRSVVTPDAFPMPASRSQRRKLKSATKKVLDVWMPATGCFRRVPQKAYFSTPRRKSPSSDAVTRQATYVSSSQVAGCCALARNARSKFRLVPSVDGLFLIHVTAIQSPTQATAIFNPDAARTDKSGFWRVC